MNSTSAASYMATALQLAARGRYSSFPNPRVGCLIVKDGKIVGQGWHARAGEPHAEIHALREAGKNARGADVYVTLEPCAHRGRTGPCAQALIEAGVHKVTGAMQDPNPLVAGKGFAALNNAGIETECGVLGQAARTLNRGFVSRMQRGRPFVTLKLGASLDGRTAMASGESKWITSEASRADVHRLRAEAGAVLTSAATVLADDPELNLRWFKQSDRQPDRIVLDAGRKVGATARVWADDGASRWWVVGANVMSFADAAAMSEVAEAPRPPLSDILSQLAQQQINSVLVESGPILAGALLKAQLVDELVLYLAPQLLGSDARAMALIPGLERLVDRIELSFQEVRLVGPDLRVTAVPKLKD